MILRQGMTVVIRIGLGLWKGLKRGHKLLPGKRPDARSDRGRQGPLAGTEVDQRQIHTRARRALLL